MSASVLVSELDHFRIESIDDGLEPLQKLVGGYIEAVTDPAGEWHLYVDEEGKLKQKPVNLYSTRFLDRLFVEAGNLPFSNFDVLVGTVVWLGPIITVSPGEDDESDEHSFPIPLLGKFVGSVMRNTHPDRPIVVIQTGNNVIVFDQPTDSTTEIKALVSEARLRVAAGQGHGVISVYPNLTRNTWVETRVELMDQPQINIDDRRHDRSYG